MTLATLAYRSSPLIGGSPETFGGGIESVDTDNSAPRSMAALSARRWLDSQQQQESIGPRDESQSFFEFEPQIGSASPFAPQYPALPGFDTTPGWNSVVPQIPSPPHSAVSPPPSWPPFQYQQPPMNNILTDVYPDTRVQYGQNTPPDDTFPGIFAAPGQNEEPERRRKRTSTANEMESCTHTKRSRKNGRSSKSSTGQASSSADDVRRSKFLERNRVAASKCRQKKKEWTQNLETRARNLQKENHSLRITLDSMRDEMIFIKGEMLKHTTCGCEQIRSWVDSNQGSPSTSPVVKMEHSPINSAPGSRCGSISVSGHDHDDQDSTSPDAVAMPRSKSPQTQNIESLLINQLTHNTNDQEIAQTVAAAA
ncbi:MAG: hypothetical protein Q9169_002611 [Polycauliona sp. 2 TL-2023]